MFFCLHVALGLAFQSPLPLEQFDREWVVRDLFSQEEATPGHQRHWSYAGSLNANGDLDGDGSVDLLLYWFDRDSSGLNVAREGLVLAMNGLHQRDTVLNQSHSEHLAIGGARIPFLYSAPAEFLLHALGSPSAGLNGGYSFRLNGQIAAQDQVWYVNWSRFFDVDHDGFEELIGEVFDSNGNVLTDCLDGRTLLPKWRAARFFPSAIDTYQTLSDPKGWPDLNRDGFPDFISAWRRWRSSQQDFTLSLAAFDGSDGTLIWSVFKHGIRSSTATTTWGPDVTNDGIADLMVCDPIRLQLSGPQFEGLIAVFSGADGSLVWERTFVDLAPTLRLPGHRAEYLTWIAGFSRPFEGHGPVHILLAVNFEDLLSTNGLGQQRTVMLDARTGTLAIVADETMSAEPWYPDSYGIMAPDLSVARVTLGDIDRDGFNEMAVRADLHTIDDPNIPGIPNALLILGRKTLHLPATARPGDDLNISVYIPSAPDHDFQLLLSQGFEADGGKRVDGWRTFLKQDALLQTTFAGRYPGRLDADGRGRLTLRLPPNPSLSGTTLYSKAVIFKLNSTTEVWTLSSLGITRIL